jgi:transposase
LGWLRGEPRHCKMVAIPTLEEEDARRPSREREIGERTRIINRMKAALIRLGIRGFKPELLKAPQRLEAQYTAEGVPIPPNMLEELRRDMARLAWVREQINAIEQARLERLEQAPSTGPHAMVRMLASIIGVGVETADMLVQEILSRNLRDRRAVARYAGLGGKAQDDDDRCTCPKASDRTVAHGYDRRNPRWCRVADGGGLNILSRSSKFSFSVLCALATAADHDPRWW